MPKKVKTARATLPSAALYSSYYKKLMFVIDSMRQNIEKRIIAAYRKHEPAIALDASPASDLANELRVGMDKWRAEFDDMPNKISSWFTKRSSGYAERSVLSALKDAGYTVKLKMTPRMRETMKSIAKEQVKLIKSISTEFHSDIEALVKRSIEDGRDLAYLKDELQNRYGVTSSRAATIARDQNNKATAMIAHTRYADLGITEAYWRHNAGSKDPRPDHLAADGKKYKISEGFFMKEKGKYVFPGQEINCHCTSRPVIPEFGDGRDD